MPFFPVKPSILEVVNEWNLTSWVMRTHCSSKATWENNPGGSGGSWEPGIILWGLLGLCWRWSKALKSVFLDGHMSVFPITRINLSVSTQWCQPKSNHIDPVYHTKMGVRTSLHFWALFGPPQAPVCRSATAISSNGTTSRPALTLCLILPGHHIVITTQKSPPLGCLQILVYLLVRLQLLQISISASTAKPVSSYCTISTKCSHLVTCDHLCSFAISSSGSGTCDTYFQVFICQNVHLRLHIIDGRELRFDT
jgi:hypothetical protein